MYQIIEKLISLCSGISISELGDLATFGLLLFTVWQYRVITKKQARQMEITQSKDISAWIGPSDEDFMTTMTVSNRSDSPVYEVVVSLVAVQGAAFCDGLETPIEYRGFLSTLPPGKQNVGRVHLDGGMGLHFGVEVAFTDSRGVNWVRKCDGSLNRIYNKAVEYYGLSRPLTWEYPTI